MENAILCGHCRTPAVAEVDGDYVCSGCLMSILMCLEEAIPINPLKTEPPESTGLEPGRTLSDIYHEIMS